MNLLFMTDFLKTHIMEEETNKVIHLWTLLKGNSFLALLGQEDLFLDQVKDHHMIILIDLIMNKGFQEEVIPNGRVLSHFSNSNKIM